MGAVARLCGARPAAETVRVAGVTVPHERDYWAEIITADRTMLADVPTQGVKTLYGLLGDWFAYADIAFVAGLIGWAIYRRIRRPAA